MFDWDDSELSTILWDEAADNGDHIVPYPKGSEDYQNKEWIEETSVVKNKERDRLGTKIDLNEKNPECSSALIKGMESWPDLRLSKASTAKREAISTGVSNNFSEITNYDSERGTNQLDKETDTYQSNHEGKEQGDFVDYGWPNIGSFDDFDRIFSNNDSVFGHSTLGNADGMWSSSRDVDKGTIKYFPIPSDLPNLGPGTLRTKSQHIGIKTEHLQNDNLPCSLCCGESPCLHGGHGILNRVINAGGESNPMGKDQRGVDSIRNRSATSFPGAQNIAINNETTEKGGKQKKLTRSRKRVEDKSQGKHSQELYGSWSSSISPSGQLENRFSYPMTQHFPSPVQHMHYLGPELFPYQHVTNQFVARPIYGNLAGPYQAMPVMSHIQPGKFKHQQLLPNYNVSPGNRNHVNKSAQAPLKPITMTPQEKIEKLRRRQQLQAMLAIEKQQQKLSQQVSSSTIQSCTQKNQGGGDLEIDDLSTFSSLEPNSPRDPDDSSAVSATIDDSSMEDILLYRLQDVITKLDMNVRLCMRDSLFRLAQSAMQRQNVTDTSSNNTVSKDEHEALSKEEISSYPRLQDREAETNPIDRTIAHLLFHRPFECLGKHAEPSESPHSIMNVPETLTNQSVAEPDQYKDSPCVVISEKALSIGFTDSGIVDADAVESTQ